MSIHNLPGHLLADILSRANHSTLDSARQVGTHWKMVVNNVRPRIFNANVPLSRLDVSLNYLRGLIKRFPTRYSWKLVIFKFMRDPHFGKSHILAIRLLSNECTLNNMDRMDLLCKWAYITYLAPNTPRRIQLSRIQLFFFLYNQAIEYQHPEGIFSDPLVWRKFLWRSVFNELSTNCHGSKLLYKTLVINALKGKNALTKITVLIIIFPHICECRGNESPGHQEAAMKDIVWYARLFLKHFRNMTKQEIIRIVRWWLANGEFADRVIFGIRRIKLQ